MQTAGAALWNVVELCRVSLVLSHAHTLLPLSSNRESLSVPCGVKTDVDRDYIDLDLIWREDGPSLLSTLDDPVRIVPEGAVDDLCEPGPRKLLGYCDSATVP